MIESREEVEVEMRRRPSQVSRRGSLATAVAAAVIVFAMVSVLSATTVEPTGSEPTHVRALALVVHDPIFIDGNDNFTISNGVTGGTGTSSDPYIIADWDINSSAAEGVWIRNSDVYFIIRYCSVYDGILGSNHGIYLENCSNGMLVGNNCWNNLDGISLASSKNNTLSDNSFSSNVCSILLSLSSNNTVINNNCSNGDFGIHLYSSSNNTLSNNNCSNNGVVGIHLYSSSNNTMSNNNCSNNWGYGIWFRSSCDNNTLIDNNCSSDHFYGMCLEQSSNNTLSNNSCLDNAIGIGLTSSGNSTLSNNSCLNNAVSIGLISSGYNTLSNNNCSNNRYGEGIDLFSSSYNTIINNNCSNNGYGIYLWASSNKNTLIWNPLCDNIDYGIYIASGFSNRIWKNDFIGNKGATSTYDPSHIQARDDGTNNWWNSSEGYGNYWSDWQTPDVVRPLGIVDIPYDISGSAGAKDYYPMLNSWVQDQDLMQQILELSNLIAQLQDSLAAATSLLAQLNTSLALTNEQLMFLNADLDDTRSDLESTNDKLNDTRSDLESTSNELDNTKNDLDSANSAVEASNQKIHNLEFTQGILLAILVLLCVLSVIIWRRGYPTSRGDMRLEAPDGSSTLALTSQSRLNGGNVAANGLSQDRRWPARAISGPLHVTAKERILLHLLHFARYADSLEVPPELTQERIAEAAGIERRHFTQYVRPLEEDELVRERTSRVRGVVQKRHIYVLTEEGARRTLGVRDRVRSAMVRVRDGSGVREVTVAEALLEGRGSMSILDVLRESIETGVVDLTRSASSGREPTSLTVLDFANNEEIDLVR